MSLLKNQCYLRCVTDKSITVNVLGNKLSLVCLFVWQFLSWVGSGVITLSDAVKTVYGKGNTTKNCVITWLHMLNHQFSCLFHTQQLPTSCQCRLILLWGTDSCRKRANRRVSMKWHQISKHGLLTAKWGEIRSENQSLFSSLRIDQRLSIYFFSQ